MPSPDEVYIKCDELDNIPKPNKDNWLAEIDLLKKILPKKSKVMQVGCMDGTRIISILKERPDLLITGLDIENSMVKSTKDNLARYGFKADVILGDITKPITVSEFDYVICLNNTLGYISDQKKSVSNMKKLGKKVIISVYGEKFTDELARKYFDSINLRITNIEKNIFHTEEFVNIRRYTRKDVEIWNGEIIETPIGYFCII